MARQIGSRFSRSSYVGRQTQRLPVRRHRMTLSSPPPATRRGAPGSPSEARTSRRPDELGLAARPGRRAAGRPPPPSVPGWPAPAAAPERSSSRPGCSPARNGQSARGGAPPGRTARRACRPPPSAGASAPSPAWRCRSSPGPRRSRPPPARPGRRRASPPGSGATRGTAAGPRAAGWAQPGPRTVRPGAACRIRSAASSMGGNRRRSSGQPAAGHDRDGGPSLHQPQLGPVIGGRPRRRLLGERVPDEAGGHAGPLVEPFLEGEDAQHSIDQARRSCGPCLAARPRSWARRSRRPGCPAASAGAPGAG